MFGRRSWSDQACGTAACATVVAASSKDLTDKNSNILFEEGSFKLITRKKYL